MNTRKQVNVMIGLMFVFAVGMFLYFLWDDPRAETAARHQMEVNAERGASLYALNCRVCHGITGLGALELPTLTGAPMNVDANREADVARIQYLRDTIRCGRVGTVMPPWSIEQGGSLNDFQIQQLILLITSEASEFAWEHAIEQANHADDFDPPKFLAAAVDEAGTTFVLNRVAGIAAGHLLRISEPEAEGGYELVSVLEAPGGTILRETVEADATLLPVFEPYLFEPGDIIQVENELMEVIDAPSRTTLAEDADATATTIIVADATGIEAGQVLRVNTENMTVQAVNGQNIRVERGADDTEVLEHPAGSTVIETGTTIEVRRGVQGTEPARHFLNRAVQEIGDEIVVERGVLGSTPRAHEEGTEVFIGPIPQPETILGTGEGFPPCGQAPAREPADAEAQEVEITGTVEMEMADDVFILNGAENPTLRVAAGDTVTINLPNVGNNLHNMRVGGPDGEFQTDDDIVSDPDVVAGGGSAVIELTLEAGTYPYHCDFHPRTMAGEIIVE
jgi:plastocyanin/mono/diheme cytochrome c family protein